MRKTYIPTILLLSIGLVSGMSSHAEAGRAKNRQQLQKARIAEGVKSGELTKREAKSLTRQQRRMRIKGKQMRADGEITAQERIRAERAQDRASRRIYRQKHDAQSRPNND